MMVNAIILVCQIVFCVYQGRTTFIHSFLVFFIIIIIINFVLNMFVHNSSTQLQSKALLHNPLLTIFTFGFTTDAKFRYMWCGIY